LQGWIKTHRRMLQSSVFKNPELFKTWMWCLMKATHKPHKQMVGMTEIELEEGQFIFGRKQAALELNLGESKIYRFIKSLEKQTKVELKPNNKFTVVTIVNWGTYQDTENENEQQMNNKRTTNEQQMDTNKNVKNVKKKLLSENFPDELKLVEFMIKKMLYNNSKAKVPDTEDKKIKWAQHLEKMKRIDGYSNKEVQDIIVFSQTENFWKSNILSTSKLREKAGQLVIQMKNNKETKMPEYIQRQDEQVQRAYQELKEDW